MDTPIRWSEKDYSNLKKAVSDFNKKIRKLEKEEGLLYLPDTKLYSETRDKITTRREYNRQIKALQDFMKAGAEELYITKGGEGISKWEWQQTMNQKRILENRLTKELASIDKIRPAGYREFRLKQDKQAEAEDTLESIQKITKLKGVEFDRIKNRIQNLGVTDFNMRKATIYRENLLKELRDIRSTHPEFKELYDKLSSITNPEAFYDEIQNSDVLFDFFKWYNSPLDYGNFEGYSDFAEYINNEIIETQNFEDYVEFMTED